MDRGFRQTKGPPVGKTRKELGFQLRSAKKRFFAEDGTYMQDLYEHIVYQSYEKERDELHYYLQEFMYREVKKIFPYSSVKLRN